VTYRHGSAQALALAACIAMLCLPARPQSVQKGADASVRGRERLRIDYVGYRAARWESEHVTEVEIDRPNQGGLIHVYYTNVSDQPLRLAFWRANRKDESYWRLGGFLAWDRSYDHQLGPGQSSVLEINAVSDEFAPGRPFTFSYVARPSWSSAGRHECELREDPVQVSYMRILPGMRAIEVHVRHTGPGKPDLTSIEVLGQTVSAVAWVGEKMDGPATAIARVQLEQPLAPSSLLIAKLEVKDRNTERHVYAHRRAFEDAFPIGVWSNNPATYALLRRHHIDTVVQGGSADHPFFQEAAAKYGFRAMAPCGKPVNVDTVRSLGDHPAVACWMLADEPDWGVQADVMLFVDRTVRMYNGTKPTFITLCRNVKFFEYASICDIPCMDHYSVTAPSSSRWPKPYGTRLEETAYYTRDLKAASEPKPIWIWTQGIASWGQRPKRPVPTPNELAAQLLLNLGRGAKGILWFNYDHTVGEKYPDTREAMQHWGRVMRLTRDDFLAAEPYDAGVEAPDKLDVAALAAWDQVLVCVANLDYEIDRQAYPFTVQQDVSVSLRLPDWVKPAVAFEIAPDGVTEAPLKVKRGKARIELGDVEVCKLLVLPNDAGVGNDYRQRYAQVIEDEGREF